ncbi:MAG: hypothetical protein ACXAEN_22565 [Candidatus Thorarchaeota archaeon]|jgi:hypothetical protein
MKELEDAFEWAITEVGIDSLDGDENCRVEQAILLVLYEAWLDDLEGHGILAEWEMKAQIGTKGYMSMSKEDFVAEVQRVVRKGKQ